jgi:predicted transposase YdaD
MSKQKTRVLVEPISSHAKDRFDELMNNIHTCKIDFESDCEFYLQSANENYYFVVQKNNDPNWKILK